MNIEETFVQLNVLNKIVHFYLTTFTALVLHSVNIPYTPSLMETNIQKARKLERSESTIKNVLSFAEINMFKIRNFSKLLGQKRRFYALNFFRSEFHWLWFRGIHL